MVRKENNHWEAHRRNIKLIEEFMRYLAECKIDFLETETLLDTPIVSFDW